VRGRPPPCRAVKRAAPRTWQRITVSAWAPPAVAHRAAIFMALSSAQVRAAGREASETRAAALLSAVKAEAAMIASLRHPNIVMFMGAPPSAHTLALEGSSQCLHAAAPIGTAPFGSQPPCRPAPTDAAALRRAGVCTNPPLIIMEFCQRGSLFDVLKQASEDPVRPQAQPSLPHLAQHCSASVPWGRAARWAGGSLARGGECWGPSVWPDARSAAHALACGSARQAAAAPGRQAQARERSPLTRARGAAGGGGGADVAAPPAHAAGGGAGHAVPAQHVTRAAAARRQERQPAGRLPLDHQGAPAQDRVGVRVGYIPHNQERQPIWSTSTGPSRRAGPGC